MSKLTRCIVSAAVLIAGCFGVSATLAAGPVGRWYEACEEQHCVGYRTVNGDLNSVLIGPNAGGPLMVVKVAADALLPFGVTLQVDNQREVRVPFMNCANGTCNMQLIINEDYVNQLRNGSVLRLGVQKNNGPQNVSISLTGFTAAYD